MTSRINVIPSGCWEWTGSRNAHGYGTLKLSVLGGHRLAHVAMWELTNGPVQAGHELDHLCRNPPCCNPDHLEPVTHAINMARSPVVGRHPRTTCLRSGHPLTGENVRVNSAGKRFCVTCRRNRQRERRAAASQ
ncbi:MULTISPECIES: HNH endonuclease signature motif containing protein [unclassified Rhodococcus (in: high G+C Gram-positive bacteria)]|uniref:HNH endonuclease signature motif containing protein n=1 Tax=unclassified Rhodococcus (in: high G+C Gram-positive bacteria) TaxID=192944 RepID=UPI0034E88BDE